MQAELDPITQWIWEIDELRPIPGLPPELMRLSEQGLLELRWQDPERPGLPPRHVYRLTATGLALALEQARSDAEAALGDPSGAVA